MCPRGVARALLVGLVLLAVAALAGGVAAANALTIEFGPRGGSGQMGTATLTDLGNGQTRVALVLPNPAGGPQPTHIHEGTCASPNPAPKYPLMTLAGGQSETIVPVSLGELLASPHLIDAHRSPAEIPVVVACADIAAPPAAPLPGTQPRAGGGWAAAQASPLRAIPWIVGGVLLLLSAGGIVFVTRREV